MYFVAALIPLLVGAVYYHPAVAGKAWMNSNKFTESDLEGANMAKIFGLTFIFSVLIAFTMGGLVIHQSAVFQMMMPEVAVSGSATQAEFNTLMQTYGGSFRTFGHGALHGALCAVFFIMPIIGINSLFERRGWKYIMIHTIYWAISLALMGGLLCQTLQFAPLS